MAEILEPVKHTEAVSGNEGMPSVAGVLIEGPEADGCTFSQRRSGLDKGEKGEVIQAVGAAEAMMRWQNKPVCHLLDQSQEDM